MLFADLKLIEIVAIEDNPDAISDHNILDLHIQEPDRILLKHPKTTKSKTDKHVISILRNCTDELPSNPREKNDFTFNFTNNTNTVTDAVLDYGTFAIQKQYIEYFNSRYNNCSFLYSPNSGAVAVYQNNDLVGGIMTIRKPPKQNTLES